jgi:uncharacterized membrane protein YdjX (TVP38/TMEM64 family)
MPSRLRRVLLVSLVVVLAVYALRGAVPVEATAESVRAFVSEAGWWGPPLFIGLFALRAVLLVPSVVLLIAGGVCFGIVGGALFGAAGLTFSALVKLVIAELAGREQLLARMPARMRRRLAFVEGNVSARTLAVVTAYPIGPAELIHVAAILAGMHALPYLVAIASGSLVRAASFSLFGDSLVEGRKALLAVAVLSLLAVLPPAVLWMRRRTGVRSA